MPDKDELKRQRASRFVYDKDNPIEFKTKCHLCRHKYAGKPGCAAFPYGIPHDLAIGNVMHDKPFAGDQGIMFEERRKTTE